MVWSGCSRMDTCSRKGRFAPPFSSMLAYEIAFCVAGTPGVPGLQKLGLLQTTEETNLMTN